ncbi:MAG: SPOR domain-containing protein [Treponema sp.]|nr:SPOR domain-containing protein [Treponema sp.]
MKRFGLVLTLVFISLSGLFAKTWFVCAGSYSDLKNAEQECTVLNNAGFDCFIESGVNQYGENFYRVLFFDDVLLRDEAREKKNRLLSSVKLRELGFSDLWICEADLPVREAENVFLTDIPEPEVYDVELPFIETTEKSVLEIPVAEPEKNMIFIPDEEEPEENTESAYEIVIPEDPVVLETNEKVELSEETPYSVFVRSYREEEKALHDRDRMNEMDLNAYVLKKYDDKAFFRFDLHAGVFKTEEEAEIFQEVLEDLGINGIEVLDFIDFSDELAKYDEVVKRESVTLNTGAYELPEVISENVRMGISQFPINRNFEIVECRILDCKNLRNAGKRIEDYMDVPNSYFKNEKIDSISFAKYRDYLFNKDLTVYILQSEDGMPDIDTVYDYKEDGCIEADFKINYGILHSFVGNEYADETFLFGYTDDKKMGIIMLAENFSEIEFRAFMDCSYLDSSLLVYPQIRRTFYILPHNPFTERNFEAYILAQVSESYASERNYAEWSLPIVGTWHANVFFDQDDEEISVGFFDMDYDYNASKVHRMFMAEKGSINIPSNKPVDVLGNRGWYLENDNVKELSFSVSSYIIALDTDIYTDLSLPELYELAEDLDIW